MSISTAAAFAQFAQAPAFARAQFLPRENVNNKVRENDDEHFVSVGVILSQTDLAAAQGGRTETLEGTLAVRISVSDENTNAPGHKNKNDEIQKNQIIMKKMGGKHFVPRRPDVVFADGRSGVALVDISKKSDGMSGGKGAPGACQYLLEKRGKYGVKKRVSLPFVAPKLGRKKSAGDGDGDGDVSVPDLLQHLRVYSGGQAGEFGVPSVSPCGLKLAYVAELTPFPAARSHFGYEGAKVDDPSGSVAGAAAEYRQSFGEGLYDSYETGAFVVDLGEGRDGEEDGLGARAFRLEKPAFCTAIGDVSWSPDGRFVCGTAYASGNEGRGTDGFGSEKLGLRYCTNRSCYVVLWDVGKVLDQAEYDPSVPVKIAHSIHHTTVARSPRFVAPAGVAGAGYAIVFLAAPSVVAHHNGHELCVAELAVGAGSSDYKVRVLEDLLGSVVDDPAVFPGVFCSSLPSKCLIGRSVVVYPSAWRSGRRLIFSSLDQSNRAVPLVLEKVHGLTRMSVAEEEESAQSLFFAFDLLDVQSVGDHVVLLILASGPKQPATLLMCRTSERAINESLDNKTPVAVEAWAILDGRELVEEYCPAAAKALADLQVSVHRIPRSYPSRELAQDIEGVPPCEYILLHSRTAARDTVLRPVLLPHGGPHSVICGDYGATLAFMTGKQFADGNAALFSNAMILVNYRGSVGFGQKSVDALPSGGCGTIDVLDCALALRHAEEVLSGRAASLGAIGVASEKCGYLGGSHSGFLGGHMLAWQDSGDLPECVAFREGLKLPPWGLLCGNIRITAAALRNPVIDIASMAAVTDIPDWCLAESALPLSEFSALKGALEYDRMLQVSPMGWWKAAPASGAIATPTMVMLGGRDARVPTHQGLQLFRAMRAARRITNLRWYDTEGHSLASSKENEADVWIAMHSWLASHVSAMS